MALSGQEREVSRERNRDMDSEMGLGDWQSSQYSHHYDQTVFQIRDEFGAGITGAPDLTESYFS